MNTFNKHCRQPNVNYLCLGLARASLDSKVRGADATKYISDTSHT